MGEASDVNSGIMLHSGPDSPVSLPKERVQAGRQQQQVLEARLDGCIQELRRLCLREAELTGTLPHEYPLKAGEKPPKVRRRIGAAFKLDEIVILRGVDPLERERALQLQIAEASRRLCREENIGRQLRKRRQTAALREEQKLRDLEQVLSQRRLLAEQQDTSTAKELSASDESCTSDTSLLEEEDTQTPGPATPRRSPSPKDPTKEEELELRLLMPPPNPWQKTSLDRPYERAKNPSIDPKDGENQSSQCRLGSLMAAPVSSLAPSSPDSAGSPMSRTGDPPYRFVPIRTLVLCRQVGASSTPEPSGRQGQTQSLRVDPCWQPAEPRGRRTTPRRCPTYYTVTVPTPCILTSSPVCCSGSDDSISDLSSISHTTSPGSSSPDVSFAVPLPLAEPGYYPRGALQLLPPASPLTLLYEQDLAPLRYQRLVPSRSRIVRTPSLKDYAPATARGLSKAAVTEELKSWHQRARLRGGRPHSLDRQGAFPRPPGGTTRDMPVARGVLSVVQGPPVQVLRRAEAGVPVQVYVPDNSEIVTQVARGRRRCSSRWGRAGTASCGVRRRRGEGAGEGGTPPGSNRAPPGCGVTAGLRRHRTGPGRHRQRGSGPGQHQDRPRERERPRSRCRRATAAPVPGRAERGHRARPRDGARRPRERLAPGWDSAGGCGCLDGGRGRRLPVVRGQKRVMAPWLRLQVLHLLLRHMPAAVLLPGPSAPAHRAPAAPLPGLQPQDHRGHCLSRGTFHRHRHHHRLLLHVLLLLLVPAPAAPPHPSARPGNPLVQLPTPSSPSSLPRGPQSRLYASPAWLHPHGHVPPTWPCCPVPHVPLRPPCLQSRSTTTLRPGTAQLSRSMSPRGDPRTCRQPAGPAWGPLGPALALGGCPSRRWIRLFPAILG